MNNTPAISIGHATDRGDRRFNADAVDAIVTPLGACAAVVDGIGDTSGVSLAAQLAADVAAAVGSHRGAQAGIMAAADTMPDYPGAPNAVAAVVSVLADGYIEIAHVGDVAVWIWDHTVGLRRWTVDQTAGAHIDHMRRNPDLSAADRRKLDGVVDVLGDYVLNGLAWATVSTIAWTPLRDVTPELILLTTDGVHTTLTTDELARLVDQHQNDPQDLANDIVDVASRDKTRPATGDALTPPRDNATVAVIRVHRTA